MNRHHFDHLIERRKDSRQPLQRELRYRLHTAGRSGSGTTLNISSNALAFQTSEKLPVGAAIEVSVNWPAEAGSTLRLVGSGVVVRSDAGVTVCTLEETAFRAEELGDGAGAMSSHPDVGRAGAASVMA
jgi:hypothetical protein